MATEPTRTQRALGLHDVPKEKWTTMVVRTFIGAIFTAVGVFLLWTEVPRNDHSLWVVGFGVCFTILGPTIWSGQIVTKAIKALLNPAKAIRALLKGEAE